MQDQKDTLEEEKRKLKTRLDEIETQLQQLKSNNAARSELVADVINSVYCGLNPQDVMMILVNRLDALNGNKNASSGWVINPNLDMNSFGWNEKTKSMLQEIIQSGKLTY